MIQKERAVVLLSGGLDSSYNLFKAHEEFEIVKVLTFNYGQRAAAKEIQTAAKLCAQLGLPHDIIELSWFSAFTQTSLVNRQVELPQGSAVDIASLTKSEETARAVWVPNRNGIFLNIAAGFAEGLDASWIIPGFNKEEAATFADNSLEFLLALESSLSFSTRTKVRTKCYSINLNKTQIVQESLQLKIPLRDLWPCYEKGAVWCRQCESCLRFFRALETNGVKF